MPSIKRNTVTEHWKKGLETRPFEAFFLKTSHTTPSENFRFCKVFRNNNFCREREREKCYRQNFRKSQKMWSFGSFFITTKNCLSDLFEEMFTVSSLCSLTIVKIWLYAMQLDFEKFSVEIVLLRPLRTKA